MGQKAIIYSLVFVYFIWDQGCVDLQCSDKLLEFKNECFTYHERLPYRGAREMCSGQGGELLTIDNEHKNEFVFEVLKKLEQGRECYWLGLAMQEGRGWKWDNGAYMVYDNWDETIAADLVDFWHNLWSSSNVGHVGVICLPDGTWWEHGVKAGKGHRFLCQYEDLLYPTKYNLNVTTESLTAPIRTTPLQITARLTTAYAITESAPSGDTPASTDSPVAGNLPSSRRTVNTWIRLMNNRFSTGEHLEEFIVRRNSDCARECNALGSDCSAFNFHPDNERCRLFPSKYHMYAGVMTKDGWTMWVRVTLER